MRAENEDEETGMAIIKRALEEPLRQIVENAGMEGSVVVQKVREGKGDYGFNARTEVYENLLKSGVIDPTKVARVALENAASIAGMLLTTECVLVEHKDGHKIVFTERELFENGGMTQGYNDRMDESLGMRHKGHHSQSHKDRRDEAKGMNKGMGNRAYQSVGSMASIQ